MTEASDRPNVKTVRANVRKGIIDDSRVEGHVYDLDELARRFSSTSNDEPAPDTPAVDQPQRPLS